MALLRRRTLGTASSSVLVHGLVESLDLPSLRVGGWCAASPQSTPSWSPSVRLRVRVALARAPARLVGGLEPGVVRIELRVLPDIEVDALARLGVGEAREAVLAHALGLREHVGELLLLVLVRGR